MTYNESANLRACIESFSHLDASVFAVDSFSSDDTVSILEEYNIAYVQHPFENYSQQRNWSQNNNPFKTPWVFHLDAGERFTPELVKWLEDEFEPDSEIDGFMFSRRTIFLNKWIRHGGHYPNFHLRLFKVKKGKCEEKVYDQHFVVYGTKATVKAGVDIIDTVTDNLFNFVRGHSRWAVFEAISILQNVRAHGNVSPKFFGNPIERKRWLKQYIFEKSPLFFRSFLYFVYRFFFRLGILDGSVGLVFHFLQGFWFRFLVDATVLEFRVKLKAQNISLKQLVEKEYDVSYLKLFDK
ncbi:MAG: glycosyltransferase family 2 protein [Imperialibacter sp.]|uniref:glycosyltransferase family 2 protein n=1 Tax=Imperialibacter sp. TaxID=2038411 RepID=UPI0032EFB46B